MVFDHQGEHDSQWAVLADLLHGDETRVLDESAYTGQGEVIRKQSLNAKGFTQKKRAIARGH